MARGHPNGLDRPVWISPAFGEPSSEARLLATLIETPLMASPTRRTMRAGLTLVGLSLVLLILLMGVSVVGGYQAQSNVEAWDLIAFSPFLVALLLTVAAYMRAIGLLRLNAGARDVEVQAHF